MKLSNIEEYVPAVLYSRGMDYFERGHVKEINEDAPGRWYARVAGTDDYEVSIHVNDSGTIRSSLCTCPFESNSLCKHEVAVCLAISQHKEENVSAEFADLDIFKQLKGMKKAELLEILKELLQQQPAVSSFLIEKLSKKDGMDETAAQRIIGQAATRAKRQGFIEWNKTERALEGAWEVQDYISRLDLQQDGKKMIRLNLIVVKECSELLEIADDSSGFIGATIENSLGMIQEVMAEWPKQLDEATIDRILELLAYHILFHIKQDMTNAPISLIEAVLQWSGQNDFGNKVYDFIERIAMSEAIKNKTFHYEEERLRFYQLQILQQRGKEQEVETFFQVHHSFPKIRKAQVLQAMAAGEYEQAISLCEESEQLDSSYAGLVHDWRTLRFEAYKQAGRTSDMVELAYSMAAKGEEEYYRLLKGLVSAENWPETLASLLEDLKKLKWYPPLYKSILINEGMNEALLEYCRFKYSEIETLYPYLVKDYPHEVDEIFTSYIYHLIKIASERIHYKAACRKIKVYKKALGEESAANLIEELKFMYPKRPALLDELSKV